MIVVLAGFVAGLIHVFMGPDHLAAIAPIATKHQRGSWLAGLVWGLGHSAGVGLVGMMSLVLREFLPVDSISEYSDRLVGVMVREKDVAAANDARDRDAGEDRRRCTERRTCDCHMNLLRGGVVWG